MSALLMAPLCTRHAPPFLGELLEIRAAEQTEEIAYTHLTFDGDKTLSRTVTFKNQQFTANMKVLSDIEINYGRAGWIWQPSAPSCNRKPANSIGARSKSLPAIRNLRNCSTASFLARRPRNGMIPWTGAIS